MQQIQINLTGELPPFDRLANSDVVEVALRPQGTTSGRSTVMIVAEGVAIEMTALNFVRAAAGIYGACIERGEIQYTENPIVMLIREKEFVELHFEHAVRTARYDLKHAKHLLSELRRMLQ